MQAPQAPGTILMHLAFFEAVGGLEPGRFFEVGCGGGGLMRRMLGRGWSGVGLEFDALSLEQNASRFVDAIRRERLQLISGDFLKESLEDHREKYDLVYSTMVMEHVEEDRLFLQRMRDLAKPGGTVAVVVPARADLWGIEDELAGHFRRYERQGLAQLFETCGLKGIEVCSLGFPLTNWTLPVGNWLIRRAKASEASRDLSMEDKTKQSGRIQVKFKYRFPSLLSLVLNDVVVYPLHVLQRCFYSGNRGTMLLCRGVRD